SSALLEGIDSKGGITMDAKEEVTALLRRTFRPEFLNRIDETVFFKPLTKENIRGIVDLLTASLAKRLEEQNLKLDLTDAAKDVVIGQSYDPVYGARPMKRYLQAKVETLIARTILAGGLKEGDTITVDAEDGVLVCR
ncbi:MAG: type VI secretion system ATPase TssH, partial [Clostridia bacterium]|nr:type VI secretion system ATPase TssH [Clostridia bacterium]